MFLSKRSNGIYYLWLTDDLGRKRKISTRCNRKSDALRFLQEFRDKELQRSANLKRTSLSQFSVDYLAYSRSVHRPSTQELCTISLQEFKKIVGDLPLQRIGVREIENFVAVKKKETSDRSARTYFVTLASAFETAKRWNMVPFNPFRLVEKPRVTEIQPAYFTKAEFVSLMEMVENDCLRDLFVCAVFTGMRLSELTHLQWIDVDFLRRVILVRNSETFTTKTRKNRVIPMSDKVYQILCARKDRASNELVFEIDGKPLTKEIVSKGLKRYVRLAGLNDKLHFHSLRHTFATWLVQGGANIYEVQKLLGHSSISMTQVYSHLTAGELHSTVNRITLPSA